MYLFLIILSAIFGVALYFFLKFIAYPLYYARLKNLQFKGLLNYLFIFKDIYIDGCYDSVLPVKSKSSRVFDIGGNIGLYSLYLNEKFDNLEIHTFEPTPALYRDLRHNLLTNQKKQNTIFTNNFGCSDKNETVTINYFPNASGLTTIQPDLKEKEKHIFSIFRSPYLRFITNRLLSFLERTHYVAVPVKVKLIKISDYIKTKKVSWIDIVKIDVEGYELQVLEGFNKSDFNKIGSFQIEIENYRPGYQSKITSILEGHGFKVSVKWANDSWSFIVATRK